MTVKNNIFLSLVCAVALFFRFGGAWAGEAYSLVHKPSNIKNGYRVVFAETSEGTNKISESLMDAPVVILSDEMDSPDINIEVIGRKGFPIHLPGEALVSGLTWKGWSTIDSGVAGHNYKISGLKRVAGRNCVEIVYEIRMINRPDVSASGRFLFDRENGVVVVNTFEYKTGDGSYSYAALLNQ